MINSAFLHSFLQIKNKTKQPKNENEKWRSYCDAQVDAKRRSSIVPFIFIQ